MKKIFLLLTITLLTINAYCQMGEWTWMAGTDTLNSAGTYGTQGIFAPANTPPALYEAAQWTDHNGHFWIFGGLNYGDLWQFDPAINQWAWIKGPGVPGQAGIYGTLNIASPSNNPGGRSFGSMTFVDTDDNLWLFGGYGSDIISNAGFLNDLWMYNITTNEWTWESGSNNVGQSGIYGTLGVADPANIPGGRCESNASWTDSHNNLWLFGGQGDNVGESESDLWKYSIANNEWTWMSGPNSTNNPAVYGTKGVEAPGNIPSGRWCYSVWKAMNDDLWLFGGWEWNNGASKNDMWRYNMATGNWTWMSGTDLSNDFGGISGIQCVPDTENIPSSRAENRACWTMGCDNFETFGGSPTLGGYLHNDLWNYSVSTNKWTWMSGTMNQNDGGNYGTILISSPTNRPPARIGSDGFKDNNGNIWLFGGLVQSSYFNDMWRFVPDTTCPEIVPCNFSESINQKTIPKDNLSIYPNPTSGTFTLSYNSQLPILNSQLKIYDVLGQQVYTQAITNPNKTTINVSQLSNGVYFYQLINNTETYRGKFVKE